MADIQKRNLLPGWFSGMTAGLLATLPMTVGMMLMQRYFPAPQKDRLPPVEITDRLADKIEAVPDIEGKTLEKASLVNHFAYGAAVGMLYEPLMRWLPFSAPAKGISYGLLVWSGSYFGLMPALGLYPNAKDEPARMNTLMILAHVIWGSTTGVLAKRLAGS